MEARIRTTPEGDVPQGTESVGDATMISYSVFASLEEVREAPAAQETVAAVPAPAPSNAPARAGSGGAEDRLQDVLSRYTDWLRTLNR